MSHTHAHAHRHTFVRQTYRWMQCIVQLGVQGPRQHAQLLQKPTDNCGCILLTHTTPCFRKHQRLGIKDQSLRGLTLKCFILHNVLALYSEFNKKGTAETMGLHCPAVAWLSCQITSPSLQRIRLSAKTNYINTTGTSNLLNKNCGMVIMSDHFTVTATYKTQHNNRLYQQQIISIRLAHPAY
jgi:hypothetical protein